MLEVSRELEDEYADSAHLPHRKAPSTSPFWCCQSRFVAQKRMVSRPSVTAHSNHSHTLIYTTHRRLLLHVHRPVVLRPKHPPLIKMVAPPDSKISYAQHTLSYPLFAADFDPYGRGYLVVGGGGGESKTGVPNQIVGKGQEKLLDHC